jgi:hypothetical protein
MHAWKISPKIQTKTITLQNLNTKAKQVDEGNRLQSYNKHTKE